MSFDLDVVMLRDEPFSDVSGGLLAQLGKIVGERHVLTKPAHTQRYSTGFRFGSGPVIAVVRPGTLVEQWRVLHSCIRAGVIIIVQAANTGLTGGSTPNGNYDRPVVIISTQRIKGIHLLDGGVQVICLSGATLHDLERTLAPVGRSPHSVIGSSCIGASVVGGICNNSGGSLVRRGPAYTELALYARLDDAGRLHLVNHLGIRLGTAPEQILERLEKGEFTEADVDRSPDRKASDHTYTDRVRDIEQNTPARFNADPNRLFEASGSAGKVMVFAVRLDSFVADARTTTFYVGSNDPQELAVLRMNILSSFEELPISAEYIHRTAFDLAAKYGKDSYLAVSLLGTENLPRVFELKARVDGLARGLNLSDRLLQTLSRLYPTHLPRRMRKWRDLYEHHLILQMGCDGIDAARDLLADRFPSATGGYFECDNREAKAAFLHRFAVAGAAMRYRAIHASEVDDIVALDVALRRSDERWFEDLPWDIGQNVVHAIYYGHFLCHVFHQDYVVKRGTDTHLFKRRMLETFSARGAECPAEHNVGHLYQAKSALEQHYRTLDPLNRFNPGIGQTSRQDRWK